MQDIVQHLHQPAGSPVPSTWIQKAINAGFFTAWPGLASKLVKKHLPKSLATAKDTSAKNVEVSNPPNQNPSHSPSRIVLMQSVKITGKIYSNQSGRFPLTAS
jgi:hypothetical protein